MTSTIEKKITVAELLNMELEEGYIYELINGEIMKRTSPNLDHQDVSANLHFALMSYIKSKDLGKILAAPTDVFLSEFDLVVPDLTFVSKENAAILKERRCIVGVPDLIIEILSKGTKGVDRGKKMKQYKAFKVKEYWIIDPRNETVEIYEWQNGDYEMIASAEETGIVASSVLAGFQFEISEIFKY